MSGLFRTLILGDIGNWLHTRDVEEQADITAFHMRLNQTLDDEQTRSIIELELAFANLLQLLQSKGILNDQEITQLVDNTESDANKIMKFKSRTPGTTLR